jgi:hypothetical protein
VAAAARFSNSTRNCAAVGVPAGDGFVCAADGGGVSNDAGFVADVCDGACVGVGIGLGTLGLVDDAGRDVGDDGGAGGAVGNFGVETTAPEFVTAAGRPLATGTGVGLGPGSAKKLEFEIGRGDAVGVDVDTAAGVEGSCDAFAGSGRVDGAVIADGLCVGIGVCDCTGVGADV